MATGEVRRRCRRRRRRCVADRILLGSDPATRGWVFHPVMVVCRCHGRRCIGLSTDGRDQLLMRDRLWILQIRDKQRARLPDFLTDLGKEQGNGDRIL
ncbi:hypothetical protein ACLOJK_028755 [Asimina triloba]